MTKFGYMIFATKDNEPCDSFYISEKASWAIQDHHKEFGYNPSFKIDRIVLNPVPYRPGTECEARFIKGYENVSFVGHGTARCLNCKEFFKEDEVFYVKPFGKHGYQTSCQGCIDSQGFIKG